MNITEKQRAEIETALDHLWLAGDVPWSEIARMYQRAIAIVRERPEGARKLRSDAGESKQPQTGVMP